MRHIIYSTTLVFIFTNILAQKSFVRVAKDTQNVYNMKEVILFAGPMYGDLSNANRKNDSYAITSGSISFNVGINYCAYIKKSFGICMGFEFSRYQNTTLYKGGYQSEEISVDKDGYYFYAVRDVDYSEKRTIAAVEIPVTLRLRNIKAGSASYFFDLGIKTHLMANSNFKQEGSLEKKGAYLLKGTNTIFLLATNDPPYGYTSTTYKKDEDMKISKFAFSFMASAGIIAKLTEFSSLVVNPSYIYCLSDLTKDNKIEYENIFQEKSPYQKLTYAQFGLRIGVMLKI